MRRIAALMMPLLLLGPAAMAQSSDAREEAAALATVSAAHELCGFDLPAAQEDLIARRRDALVETGSITPEELADIEAELTISMKRQVPEGLCRPDGPAAKFYHRTLDALGGH